MRREKGRMEFSFDVVPMLLESRVGFLPPNKLIVAQRQLELILSAIRNSFVVFVMTQKLTKNDTSENNNGDGSIIAWMFKSDAFCVCARRIRAWHSSVTSSPPTIGGVDRFRNSAVRIRKLKSTAAEES
jgi:hypothetical protein